MEATQRINQPTLSGWKLNSEFPPLSENFFRSARPHEDLRRGVLGGTPQPEIRGEHSRSGKRALSGGNSYQPQERY